MRVGKIGGGETVKLTENEQKICDEYSRYRKDGKVNCSQCPLMISRRDLLCYATIDGRTKEARKLERR